MSIARITPVLFALTVVSCGGRSDEQRTFWLVLKPKNGLELRVDSLHVEPHQILQRVEHVANTLALMIALPKSESRLKVSAKGACPISLDTTALKPDQVVRKDVLPFIDFGPPNEQVGYGAEVTITGKPACPEARQGSISWSQIAGEPLGELHEDDHGFTVRTHTLPMRHFFRDAKQTPGIVAISPRTRGTAVLEARWSGPAASESLYNVTVASAARSSGMPNVPLDHRVYLTASEWQLVLSPDGSRAALAEAEIGKSFQPDVAGHYRFRDDAGEELSVFAQRYDATPLDCGRSECHADLAKAAAASPMATILKRGLSGWLQEPYDVSCAIGCHSAGEPGLHDGGFWHLAADLDVAMPEPNDHAYDALPAALRRVGGVGCFACHGPGMIPEPAGRWAILRADVCAVCHDAPPRYGHVVAWRASRMARADHDEAARTSPECNRCHTTSGFLTNIGALAQMPPVPANVSLGIGCAACHAAHAHGKDHSTEPPSLLRSVAIPDLLTKGANAFAVDEKARICLPCHAPESGSGAVSASAAAIWAGKGGVDPNTSVALDGSVQHVAIQGGCIGCHASGPSNVERGRSHAFGVDGSKCSVCHGQKENTSTALRTRATALFAELSAGRAPQTGATSPTKRSADHSSGAPAPFHATPIVADRTTKIGRALYDVLLVLEDPAAGVHNAPYARKLLDAAEGVLKQPIRETSPGSFR